MKKQTENVFSRVFEIYWDLTKDCIALAFAAFIKLYFYGFFGLYKTSLEAIEAEKILNTQQKQHLRDSLKNDGDYYIAVTIINIANIVLTLWIVITWLNRHV